MGDQGPPSNLRVNFQATRIASTPPVKLHLPPEFIERLVDLIEPLPDKSKRRIGDQISRTAQNYVVAKSLSAAFSTAKESRAALKSLDRPFRLMLDTIDKLSIDYQIMLAAKLAKEMGNEDNLGSLLAARQDLEKLQRAVTKVLDSYKPKGGAAALSHVEQCVGALMLLFEQASGKRATVSLTKEGDHDPRTTSPQAEAILLLMTTIDASLEPVTVIGKIGRIGRKYRGKMLTEFDLILWLQNQTVTPIPAPPKA